MNLRQEYLARLLETTRSVAFADKTIECGGLMLTPDATKGYVEFHLAHAFPVVSKDQTGFHPQVVANSYGSMIHQVFNLAHLMKANGSEENPIARDRILGSIVAVEFAGVESGSVLRVETGGARSPSTSSGRGSKLQVPSSKEKAPGIRAVAVIHKRAEGVARILGEHQSGRRSWSVSLEASVRLEDSGIVLRKAESGKLKSEIKKAEKKWDELKEEFSTPDDLLDLGWVYVPCLKAPEELLECLVTEESLAIKAWDGFETALLVGGLDGAVHFKGVAMAPLGTQKEEEAHIASLLAAAVPVTSEPVFSNQCPVAALGEVGELFRKRKTES